MTDDELNAIADYAFERPHPEKFCQRCGAPNPVWNVDSDRYNTACNRSEIVCPSCFIFAHEQATGMETVWQLTPMTPFRWVDDTGRPTPFVQADRALADDLANVLDRLVGVIDWPDDHAEADAALARWREARR